MDRSRDSALASDRNRALLLTPVSRETLARLDQFVAALLDWRQRTNLIAASTVPKLWTRHIADSLQLLDLAPGAKVWIDLGAGAGFPGLAIACALADRPDTAIHLVESNRKKAAFLNAVCRQIAIPAEVHNQRIEEFTKHFKGNVDVVTARALAPLPDLLELAAPLLKTGALGLFPKGQDVEAELTAASKYWKIQPTLVPSKTNPQSRIVVVRGIERLGSKPKPPGP